MGSCGGVEGLAVVKRQAPAGDFLSAGWAPPPPGYRRHPPRSYLLRVERGNPDGVPASVDARVSRP